MICTHCKEFHISPKHYVLEKPSRLGAPSCQASKFWCNAENWNLLGVFLKVINHDSSSATLWLLWVKFDSPTHQNQSFVSERKKLLYYSRNENLLAVGTCASLKAPSLKLRACVMKTFVSLILSQPQSEHYALFKGQKRSTCQLNFVSSR